MENERAHAELRLQMLRDEVKGYQGQVDVLRDMLNGLERDLGMFRDYLATADPEAFPTEEPEAPSLWRRVWSWVLKPVW